MGQGKRERKGKEREEEIGSKRENKREAKESEREKRGIGKGFFSKDEELVIFLLHPPWGIIIPVDFNYLSFYILYRNRPFRPKIFRFSKKN